LARAEWAKFILAQDTKLDRKVALKILPVEVAAHPDRMKRFVSLRATLMERLPTTPRQSRLIPVSCRLTTIAALDVLAKGLNK
jgi:hypothetical protein